MIHRFLWKYQQAIFLNFVDNCATFQHLSHIFFVKDRHILTVNMNKPFTKYSLKPFK
jgi:hypothetical protein